jgi:hypothetical protein
MRHDRQLSPGPPIPPHVNLDAPCGGGGKEDVSVGGGGGTTEQLPAEEVGVVRGTLVVTTSACWRWRCKEDMGGGTDVRDKVTFEREVVTDLGHIHHGLVR